MSEQNTVSGQQVEQDMDYAKGKAAIWIEEGIWRGATPEQAKKLLNDKVRAMGARDANAWVRDVQMMMVGEESLAADLLKRQINAACCEICDKRFAVHYPVITDDITDEHYLKIFSMWSAQGLPLSELDMQILKRHLGVDPVESGIMDQVREDLEFTVCGYCGL